MGPVVIAAVRKVQPWGTSIGLTSMLLQEVLDIQHEASLQHAGSSDQRVQVQSTQPLQVSCTSRNAISRSVHMRMYIYVYVYSYRCMSLDTICIEASLGIFGAFGSKNHTYDIDMLGFGC